MKRILYGKKQGFANDVAVPIQFLSPFAMLPQRVVIETIVVDPLVPIEAPILSAVLVGEKSCVKRNVKG